MNCEDHLYRNRDPRLVTRRWLGAVDPASIREAKENEMPLPSLHSSKFAPLPGITIQTGVKAMTSVVLELMKK